jgi:hypothetical protein
MYRESSSAGAATTAKYYDRQVRGRRERQVGDRVWLFNPPRGPKATKFVHPWMGPLQIIEAVGYENYLLRRQDKTGKPEDIVAHASFLVSFKASTTWLEQAANDLRIELDDEESEGVGNEVPAAGAAVRSAAAPSLLAACSSGKRQRTGPTSRTQQWADEREPLVEQRRRKQRNKAGQYVLEILLRPTNPAVTVGQESRQARWVSVAEYEDLCDAGKVVEDLGCGEGV